jgi:hypothetical protein
VRLTKLMYFRPVCLTDETVSAVPITRNGTTWGFDEIVSHHLDN